MTVSNELALRCALMRLHRPSDDSFAGIAQTKLGPAAQIASTTGHRENKRRSPRYGSNASAGASTSTSPTPVAASNSTLPPAFRRHLPPQLSIAVGYIRYLFLGPQSDHQLQLRRHKPERRLRVVFVVGRAHPLQSEFVWRSVSNSGNRWPADRAAPFLLHNETLLQNRRFHSSHKGRGFVFFLSDVSTPPTIGSGRSA